MKKISKVDVKQDERCYLGFTIITKTVRIIEKKGNKRTKPVSFQDMLILPFHSPTLQCFAHEKKGQSRAHLVVGADQQLSLCWPLEGKGPQVQREEELRGGSTGAVSRFLPELSPCIWELLAAAPKAGLNNVFVFHEELKAIEISSC